MGDYLTGLLQGFQGRKSEIEAQTYAEAQASRAREGKVFEALINSPDPQVKSLAVAGLLHSAEPGKRKSGLSGWLGEMEQSPYLPQIQALINQPVTTTTQHETLPSRQTAGYLAQGPGQVGSLAQPSTSPTEVGAPPPTPLESPVTVGGAAGGGAAAPTLSAPTPFTGRAITRAAPPTPYTTSTTAPREVFEDPIKGYEREMIAKAGAGINAEIGAWTPHLGYEGAVDAVLQKYRLSGRGGWGV